MYDQASDTKQSLVMQTFRAAGCLFSELLTSRLSSHAAASCSGVTPLEQLVLNRDAIGSYLYSRHFVSAGVCPRAPAGIDKHLSCDFFFTAVSWTSVSCLDSPILLLLSAVVREVS